MFMLVSFKKKKLYTFFKKGLLLSRVFNNYFYTFESMFVSLILQPNGFFLNINKNVNNNKLTIAKTLKQF